ncbi:hypothetical protein MXB_4910, partial [Myxobolus squamalis]
MHIVSLAEVTKELLFGLTYGVIRVRRFNFSSHTSILHVMHDHHGIQPNHKPLMSAKDEYLNCEVLYGIIVALKCHWLTKLVVVNFEKALLNAVHYKFT